MKPIIGLTPSFNDAEKKYMVNKAHCFAIELAGGIPIILPYSEDKVMIQQMVDSIAGLYLTGGDDIDPHYFNEEPHGKLGQVNPLRDQFEIQLVKETIARNKPLFGVCRGCQVLNIALGGSMYQDLASQKDSNIIQHKQKRSLSYPSHFVYVDKDSLLFDITKEDKLMVNSSHHQANRIVSENLVTSATSGDGVIEAIEGKSSTFILGVQWHPEQLVKRGDKKSIALYERFVKETTRD
jgi:putative glutamine amidotransferase